MYFCTEVSNYLKFLSRFNILHQTVPKANKSFTLILEKLCFKIINFKFHLYTNIKGKIWTLLTNLEPTDQFFKYPNFFCQQIR